ncbi:hypothetical protein Tdes44962_MAKER01072 [Teratosphaeria destructans]|uniref:Uncharacterized protein n=1 Tax=Teratosphaeria destructans TaxID=418781 RepID=A0A9W7SIC3_9PEZI|nr:hypothetical protein Tdes44962_MAKER01072 [Teratosphaeria destructans]
MPGLSLLCTCQQINMEAHSSLYERDACFSSQSDLFTWIQQSRQSDLRKVKRLTLTLTDIDLSSLRQKSRSQRPLSAYSAAWSLYVEELERLREALEALPMVTELAVLPPSGSQSKLLRGLYLAFLGLIARDCPGLRQLSIDDDEEIVRIVPELKSIPHVVFLRGSFLSVGPGVIPDEPEDEESNKSIHRGFRSQCRKRNRQLRDGIVKRIKLEVC